MAGIKITDLPAAPSALLTDVFPVDQLPGPITYKESNQQLLTLFQTQIAANGQPLTKTDDTNVTLTLGGSPTIALLNPASLTLGWTGLLGITRGGTGVGSVTTSPTATAWAGWDANSNLSANNFLGSFATNVSAAGTTILTVASAYNQEITGATTETIQLPVASTLATGHSYKIINNSSGAVTINSSGGNAVLVMAANTTALVTNILNSGTTAASWNAAYIFDAGGGVLSITGTANQIIASAATGAVTLSAPQDLNTTAAFQVNTLQLNSTNGLLDANGAVILGITVPIASAVNALTLTNAASGSYPILAANGADTNVGLHLQTKGTGIFNIDSVATNSQFTFNTGTSYLTASAFTFPDSGTAQTYTWPGTTGTVCILNAGAHAVTNGFIPIGDGTTYSAAALTAGTGISIANGSGSVTITATGGGLAVATIAGTSQSAAVNTKYFALAAGQTTLTLPTVYAVGDIVALVGSTANTGGWIVATASGDTIRVNNATTSASGTVTSAAVAGQTIYLECDVANQSWVMTSTVSTILTTS